MDITKIAIMALSLSSAFPAALTAKDAVVKTDEGIAVTYALNSTDRIARVKGYAETMKTKITIPSKIKVDGATYTVTKIGAAAFKDADFNTISLPSTITLIDNDAFLDSWVKTCPIPPNVERIGDNAFMNAALKTVTIPASCSYIGAKAFAMASLERLTIEDAWTKLTIGDYAFMGGKITELKIPYRVTSVGVGAFERTNVVDVVWPEWLPAVPTLCFYNCNFLRSVTLPFGVTSVGERAFSECEELAVVKFPTSLVTIGEFAFWRAAIRQLSIPEGVTTLGEGAFQSCDALVEVYLPSTLRSIGETCFQGSEAISTVCCDALTPPVCGASPFSTPTFDNARLIVPEQVWRLYAEADWWAAFRYDGYSGVGAVTDDTLREVDVEYFDMQGRRIATPQPGQTHIRVERGPRGSVTVTRSR